MPIFIHPVRLFGTRMFGTRQEHRHLLVLEVDAESASTNSLVVPLSAASGAGTVEKVEASELALGWDGRRRLFDDLEAYYHGPPVGRPGGGQAFFGVPRASASEQLASQAHFPTRLYPSFETSLEAVELVASSAVLGGLEPSLRPGPEIQSLLDRRYPGQPLALCPFPAGLGRIFVAVRYQPRDPTQLVFPLLELTDGVAPAPRVMSDQDVLGQNVELYERVLPFDRRHATLVPASPPPFPRFVRPEAPVDLASLRGPRENEDLRAPLRAEG